MILKYQPLHLRTIGIINTLQMVLIALQTQDNILIMLLPLINSIIFLVIVDSSHLELHPKVLDVALVLTQLSDVVFDLAFCLF